MKEPHSTVNESRQSGMDASTRRAIYAILILVALGAVLGRVLAIDSVDRRGLEKSRLEKAERELERKRTSLEAAGLPAGEIEKQLEVMRAETRRQSLRRPFLSANDRSRWCAVRALVETDMRVPGAPYAIDKVIQEPGWDTIDMVKHVGPDGIEHLYSSKPPLMSTLMAAVYWPVYNLGGVSLGTHPFEIGRAMVVLFNVVPLAIYFFLLASLIERFGRTDWGRIFTMAAACFGTFLTTFAVSINNHLPAAVCATAAIFAVVKIYFDDRRLWRYFILAGFLAALAATFELPAVGLLAALGLAIIIKSWKQTLLSFLPAVLVVAAAYFATNYIAHGVWEPAYAHRGGENNWYDYTYQRNGKTIESYWRQPQGVDVGEPHRGVYAANLLVGHHGMFSLTPIWLLSVVGSGIWMFTRGDRRIRWASAVAVAFSAVCIAFYIWQPAINRNYGGMTSGPRWLFWLAPLWLLLMIPMVDWMSSRRWTRGLALALLAASVLSASYPTWNPWVHPWLMDFAQYVGWTL
jgi:hypothetical protein